MLTAEMVKYLENDCGRLRVKAKLLLKVAKDGLAEVDFACISTSVVCRMWPLSCCSGWDVGTFIIIWVLHLVCIVRHVESMQLVNWQVVCQLFRSCLVMLVHSRMLVLLGLVLPMSFLLTWRMLWWLSRPIICAYLMVKSLPLVAVW